MSQLQLLKRESQVEVPATGEKYVAEDGTVSQVLDDTASPDYEPTEAEITEFAEWIGMKLPEDQPYLWMAREALKTPLPKEWRPCRTEEDEVYYFNFKTGDSQWEHPLDDQFRQRFAKEKERVQKGGALAAAAAATRRSQDRVIMTASGVLRVDGSGTTQPASTTATATTTTTTTAAAPAKSAVASKSPGTSVEDGAPTSGSLSSLMSTTNGAAGRQLAPSMSRGTPNTSAVAGAATGSSVSANNNNNNNSNNMRILSEAERNLESRIHAEMQKEFEVEQATRSEEQARKLAELRALHNKDLSELRAVHEKRLEVIQSELEGSMRSAATEMRRRCDDAFRPRFDELQQQTNQSQGQLNEMEAAYERAGGAARSVIIAKAEDDLKKELKRVEEDVRRRQVIKQKELQQRFLETKTLMEESSKTALVDARTALEKTFYQHEMEAAKTTEARRKALETQKKKLEQDLSANKAQLAAAAAAPPRTSSSSASAVGSTPIPAPLDASTLPEVQEIQRRQRKLSEEIAAQSTRDVAAIERETENRLTALRAEYAKAAAAAKTSSLNTSVSSSTTAGGSPTTPFAQHLRALKSRYNAKKAEQLRALGEDRDRQLSSIRRPSATASTASNSADGAEGGSPLQLLQQKHDAELAEKKAFYKSVREQVGQQLRSELEDSASISQSIARAVEHDMAAYTQEVAARHARLAAEMEQKRAKALEEHRIARQNYDKRVELEKQRRRDDEEDAMESMMEGIIADAVADVRRTGEAQTEAMLATRRKAATMAEAAVRAEVDAFMTALEAAEHKKMDLEVEASRAASAATSAAAASEAGARQAEELARRRCDMDQQRRVQEEEVRSLQSQLRQREERLRDIMREKVEAQTQAQAAVPVAGTYTPPPAPAAASPGAAVERTIIVVPRKVQPPRSLVRADHQQRLQRLEMSYQAEVERLRALPPPAAEMPLQHSSIINGTSPIHPSHTSSNPAVVVEVGGGGGSPVATSHAMTTTTTTTTAPPATRAEALNFSADDARRYWKQQQQAMQQTQQNLLAAREEWSQDVWYLQQQQQQQQQQQVQLQQSYRQSSPVATGGSYPRRMATPSCGYDHLSAPSALTTNTSPLIALVGSLHQRLDALTEATSLLQRSSSAGGEEGHRGAAPRPTPGYAIITKIHLRYAMPRLGWWSRAHRCRA